MSAREFGRAASARRPGPAATARGVCLPLALAALSALACARGLDDPGRVADRFVDKYYVESDQQGALAYASAVAALRLRDELKLAAEGRAPGMDGVARQVRVYYKRASFEGQGDARAALYRLDIRPQGGGELRRDAHLELRRDGAGRWTVSAFHETQPE